MLSKFLRYVRYDTQSDPSARSKPSTAKQKRLSLQLKNELSRLGLRASVDRYGTVMATIPSNVRHKVPTIGWIQHVDTAPDAPGKNVRPQVHRNYNGRSIWLPVTGERLTPKESPRLLDHKGETIVTSDGSTLLGGDPKAGVAIIMTAVERLVKDPSIKHGKIRIAFTTDEEIGRGTEHFNVKKFGAKYAYTVDGGKPGEIANQTFNADTAVVTFKGVTVHPGDAYGKLVNAGRMMGAFTKKLPKGSRPEHSKGRRGFIYLDEQHGDTTTAQAVLLLRHFKTQGLQKQRKLVRKLAREVKSKFPGGAVKVEVQKGYRNMASVLKKHPEVVKNAKLAAKRAGIKPRLHAVRGGTDGSSLSFMGLPTADIFTGVDNMHSVKEWVAVEGGMVPAVNTLVQMAQIWANKSKHQRRRK